MNRNQWGRILPRLIPTLVGALAGFGSPAQAEKPVHGGRILIMQAYEPSMLSAGFDSAAGIQLVSSKILEGLLSYDFELKPHPTLAESWAVSEDGLRITFNLRKNVKWHDGKPFTSKDVAFSAIKVWKELHGRGRLTYRNLASVETPDDHTAIFVLANPSPYIVQALAGMESPILPAHLYEGTDVRRNAVNDAPVGTGPFKFKSWTRGSNVIVERNLDYWDIGKPYLDEIIFQTIPDDASRAAALEAGQADLSFSSLVPLSDVKRFEENPGFTIEQRGYEYLAVQAVSEFNLDRDFIKDVKVRQAIAHAVDTAFIRDTVWYGFGTPSTGPIHRNVADFYTADVPAYEYDIEKANALLDAAGYAKGSDGFRFSLAIAPMPFGDQPPRIAEYLKQTLSDIGINVSILNDDFAGYVKRVYTDRAFDLAIWTSGNGPDPVIGVQRGFLSSNFIKGLPFSNSTHYKNPRVDELLIGAGSEVDIAKRRALYEEFQKIIMAELPRIPLTDVTFVTIANSKLKNFTVTAQGVFDSMATAYLSKE